MIDQLDGRMDACLTDWKIGTTNCRQQLGSTGWGDKLLKPSCLKYFWQLHLLSWDKSARWSGYAIFLCHFLSLWYFSIHSILQALRSWNPCWRKSLYITRPNLLSLLLNEQKTSHPSFTEIEYTYFSPASAQYCNRMYCNMLQQCINQKHWVFISVLIYNRLSMRTNVYHQKNQL